MHDLSPVDAIRDKVFSDVARLGWSAIGVMPTADDPPDTASFTYTIGLVTTWEHPELIIHGMDSRRAHSLLACAIDDYVAKGQPLEPGETYDRIIRDYPTAVVRVSDEAREAHFGMARRFHQTWDFEALQLVWPDKEGRFPWDEGARFALQVALD